jgi:thioredoxin 1
MSVVLTDDTFDTELKANIPVMVDFWAAWCGPCRMLAPAIDSLSEEFAGKVKVCKLNVDENGVTAKRFKIESIPTVIIFKNGQILEELRGALPKNKYVEVLNKYIV